MAADDYESEQTAGLPLFAAAGNPVNPASEAAAKRDDALQRVEEHASPDWIHCAESALATVIQRGAPFTSEDVWAELETNYTGASTHEPRAMGPVISRAVRDGKIQRMDYVPSRRATRNRAPVARYAVVWQRGTAT